MTSVILGFEASILSVPTLNGIYTPNFHFALRARNYHNLILPFMQQLKG